MFSEELLIRGTPRQVLIQSLPGSSLLEAIQMWVERTDIADFVSVLGLIGCAAGASREIAKQSMVSRPMSSLAM